MAKTSAASEISEVQAADLISRGAYILDVRTRVGALFGVVPGARWIALARLWRNFHELPADRPILVYCRTGRRAGKAKLVLDDVGFHAVNGGRFRNIAKIVEAQRAAPGPSPTGPR